MHKSSGVGALLFVAVTLPIGVQTEERVWFVRPYADPRLPIPTEPVGNWKCPDGMILPDPIVVVGTDGSGTRVVAKLLAMLNSTVLVERAVYSQMDVDGRAAGTQ